MKRILLLLFLINSSLTFAQNVDLTSVDEFFKITDKLKNGKEIDEEQWSQFESSTAYSIMDSRIIDIVKTSINYVFGSSESMMNLENTNMLERLFVENYKEVNNNYSDIKDFRNNYDFEMLISKAKFRLQSFLECEMLDSSAKLKPVYFLFLNADAQDRDEAIVVDLNFIYSMDEDARVNLIAHEFFHAYRRHFENHDFNYANDINFAIDMIANEGVADQIDKYNMDYNQYYSSIINSQELAAEFTALYDKAEEDIEYLQTIVVQYLKSEIDFDVCVDKLLSVYKYNGHVMGFYMSNQIVKAGLKDEMVKGFHNPYEFYRLYDLTLRDKGKSLDEDFLNYLKESTK